MSDHSNLRCVVFGYVPDQPLAVGAGQAQEVAGPALKLATLRGVPRLVRGPVAAPANQAAPLRGQQRDDFDNTGAKDVVGNNSPFCTNELGCTARRKTRRATG